MFAVKPFRGSSRQEELASVSIFSRIGHGENTWNLVRDELWWFSPLVFKFLAIDGLSPSSIRICKVSALTHKSWNHTMENGILVMQLGSTFSYTLFTSAQGPKVLGCFGYNILVEFHGDAANLLVSNFDVKEDSWIVFVRCRVQNHHIEHLLFTSIQACDSTKQHETTPTQEDFFNRRSVVPECDKPLKNIVYLGDTGWTGRNEGNHT
mmetsp:Transcript_37874/g.91847  ORF Transcript_37874/g.91847 Transcript_37874/m.91847 type:complete len:208 (-) Transcript_37874:155-778(-)